MGVCLSKRYVYAKNDYPHISVEGNSTSGTEKSSSYLRICMEKQGMNPCSHLFGNPRRIQSSPSKLLGLFMRHVSPVRSKIAICHGPKIPTPLCEHANSIENDDLSPRLNVVKSGNSVVDSGSEDCVSLRSTEEPSATEKPQSIQMGSGLNVPLTEDYIMKCGLQDRFQISESDVLGVDGSEGIINALGERSSQQTPSHDLEGGAFGSPFSIDTCQGAEFRQGAEIIKRSQQPRYISHSHQGQHDAIVAATTELPYSRSCQDNEDKSSQGAISDAIIAHSKQYAVADSLASRATMADSEYPEDTSSESSSDLFDIEFLSSDVLIGPCAD